MSITIEHNEFTFDRSIVVNWWRHPNESIGFDPRSQYVERFWLPVLGPSATFLLRHLARTLDGCRNGTEIELAETAYFLGLGDRYGRHAPFMRSINRVISFKMACATDAQHLSIRRLIPPLSARHLSRFPESLRAAHDSYLNTERSGSAMSALEQRGQQLALSLLALDESLEDVEQQLVQWRFPGALAYRCVRQAERLHRKRTNEPVPAMG